MYLKSVQPTFECHVLSGANSWIDARHMGHTSSWSTQEEQKPLWPQGSNRIDACSSKHRLHKSSQTVSCRNCSRWMCLQKKHKINKEESWTANSVKYVEEFEYLKMYSVWQNVVISKTSKYNYKESRSDYFVTPYKLLSLYTTWNEIYQNFTVNTISWRQCVLVVR